MATTADAVRARMAALVTALVPSVHAGQRFQESRHEAKFRDYFEANPANCLRQFSVRAMGDTSQALVTDHTVERVEETMRIEVAYPVDWRHGGRQLVGLDSAMAADAKKIDAAIGVPSSDATLKGLATVFRGAEYEREQVGPVVFMTITYRIEYARSLA